MTTARVIWSNLEQIFSVTNESRKYKLNKELYENRQNNMPINDYYTLMKSLWEEVDCMNILPVITNPNAKVKKLLKAIDLHKEESKLFQFLNGVDDIYNPHWSQLLMMIPLQNVESACSVLRQEEAQRELLKTDDSLSAMYGKSNLPRNQIDRVITCSACGIMGHNGERCWTVVGYPKWHPKNTRTVPQHQHNKPKKPSRMAASAHAKEGNTSFIAQLAKLMPQLQAAGNSHFEPDEDLDHFSGMITCCQASNTTQDWIIDSGASDHMTAQASILSDYKMVTSLHINLPNGNQAKITHVGIVILPTGLQLQKVLCVPNFKHNLLSVQNLIKDSNCALHFFPTYCLIVDKNTGVLMGWGKLSKAYTIWWISCLQTCLPLGSQHLIKDIYVLMLLSLRLKAKIHWSFGIIGWVICH